MSVHLYPIFTQTVGSGGASTITFNNIPQGYTDLVVQYSLASNAATGFADGNMLYVNGSFSTGSWTQVYGTGSGVGVSNSTNSSYIGVVTAATSTSNTFTSGSIYLSNYTSGNYKHARVDAVFETNATGAVQHFVANTFRTNAPITSLALACGNGSFVQNSTVTIYGVSNQFATQLPTAPTITSITDQAGFASISFLPTAGDTGTRYAVTDNNSNTTYGAFSPIVAPATLGSATTYTAKSINTLGTAAAAGTASITSSNSYTSIATATSPSGGTVSFINIPQNYSHLQLRVFVRGTYTGSGSVNENPFFRLNGSTSYQFAGHSLFASTSSAYSQGYTGINYGDLSIGMANAYLTANVFGCYIIDILDYTSTVKNKTIKMVGGYQQNGLGAVGLSSTIMLSNDPITTISQFGGTSQTGFAAGTSIALYGIA